MPDPQDLMVDQQKVEKERQMDMIVQKALQKRRRRKKVVQACAERIIGLQEKQGGYWSEFFSQLNPLNWYAGNIAGGGAALATPTRSLQDQARRDELGGAGTALANLLIPGVGPYNAFKRLGTSIRGPELKSMKSNWRAADEEEEEQRYRRGKERREKQEKGADDKFAQEVEWHPRDRDQLRRDMAKSRSRGFIGLPMPERRPDLKGDSTPSGRPSMTVSGKPEPEDSSGIGAFASEYWPYAAVGGGGVLGGILLSKLLRGRKKDEEEEKLAYNKLAMMVPSIMKVIHNNTYGPAAGGFKPAVPVTTGNGWSSKRVRREPHSPAPPSSVIQSAQ